MLGKVESLWYYCSLNHKGQLTGHFFVEAPPAESLWAEELSYQRHLLSNPGLLVTIAFLRMGELMIGGSVGSH